MDESSRTNFRKRPVRLALAALLLFCGCESLGTTTKHKNPVVPPPPRTRLISREDDTGSPGAQSAIDRDAAQADQAATGRATMGPKKAADARLSADRTPLPRGERATPRNAGAGGGAALVGAQALDDEGDRQVSQISDSGRASGWKSNAVRRPSARPNSAGSTESGETAEDDPTRLRIATKTEGAGRKVEKGEVAAIVNGVPIFVDDVLYGFGPSLKQAEKLMAPEEFRRQRVALLKKHLQPHVEQELLLQALKGQLKDDRLAGLKKQIDSMFDEDLLVTMKKLGVSTRGELESQLRKSGSSVEILKTNFRNRQLAQQYLQSRTVPRSGFDLPDLHQHYQENKEKYAVPGRVKWQQIQLTYAKHGGKPPTQKLAKQVVARLEAGEEFAQIAREVSDGPTAVKGGYWDWTIESSLKSKELDLVLFEMPVGDEFAMIEGPEAIDIAVVLDRHDAGYKSFESVQTEIASELKMGEFRRSVQELLAELREKATIEMHADRP